MPDTPYLTPAAIRARVPALASEGDYPDSTLSDLVTEFEGITENYRGVAFTARTAVSETHTLDRERVIVTKWPVVSSVTSVAVVDRALVSTSVLSTDWQINRLNGIVDLGGYYTGVATIVYAHGITTPPAGLVRACRLYVRACAMRDDSGIGRDVVRQGFDGGGSTTFSTPDKDHPTGYLDVDRLLNQLEDYRRPGIA